MNFDLIFSFSYRRNRCGIYNAKHWSTERYDNMILLSNPKPEVNLEKKRGFSADKNNKKNKKQERQL